MCVCACVREFMEPSVKFFIGVVYLIAVFQMRKNLCSPLLRGIRKSGLPLNKHSKYK